MAKKIFIIILLTCCIKTQAQVTSPLTQITTDLLKTGSVERFNWSSFNLIASKNKCQGYFYAPNASGEICYYWDHADGQGGCITQQIGNCRSAGTGGGGSSGGGGGSTGGTGSTGTSPTPAPTPTPTPTPPPSNPNWGTGWLNIPNNPGAISPYAGGSSSPWNNNEPTGGGSNGNGKPIEPNMDLGNDKGTKNNIDTTKKDSLQIINEPCDSLTIKTALRMQQALNKIRSANDKIDSLYNSVATLKDTFELGLGGNIDTLGVASTTKVFYGDTTSVLIEGEYDYTFHTHHKLLFYAADYGDFHTEHHDTWSNNAYVNKKDKFRGSYIFGADSSLVAFTMTHNPDYNIMEFNSKYPMSFDINNMDNNYITAGSPLEKFWDKAYFLAKSLKFDMQTAYLYAGAYTIAKSNMGFKYFKAKNIASSFEQIDVDIIETPTHNILLIKKCN